MTLPWVHDSQPLTRLWFPSLGAIHFKSLGKIWTCGNWAIFVECLHCSFLSQSWLTLLVLLFKKKKRKEMVDWVAKAADHGGNILVFRCPSVCLTGPRSNSIRKVLFCFILFCFSYRVVGKSLELELAVMSKSVCFLKCCLFVWNWKGKMNCSIRWAVLLEPSHDTTSFQW